MRIFNRLSRDSRYLSREQVFFNTVTVLDNTPDLKDLKNGEFLKIINNKKPYWAIFRCPCGCSKVISLSLQKVHSPHWTVTESRNGKPTVYPSIWQVQGCLSHFWIEDGNVYWCKNTGIEPWIAEPKYYSKPNLAKSQIDV